MKTCQISGFGGSYEWGCQRMLQLGLEYFSGKEGSMKTTVFQQAIQLQINAARARHKPEWREFKERTVDSHTIGDFIRAVLAINTEADATEFYRGYIEWLEVQPDRTHSAKYVADANIGWCFGEGMSAEKQAMWGKCTTATHPIFGRSIPSPEEAFAAGVKVGKRALSK